MIIDLHTHILNKGDWPDEWFDWVAHRWAAGEAGREPAMIRDRIEDGLIDPDGDRMVGDMDSAGVDQAVALAMDWGPEFIERTPIAEVNAHTIALGKRHQGRILPFVSTDPRRSDPEGLVEDGLQAGACGVKLNPTTGFDPFDTRLHGVYELCIEYQVPVLFHTGETLGRLSVRYGNPLLLQDVYATFPRLKSIIAHAGAKLWWREALSVAAHSINSYLEFSGWIWADTSEADKEALIRRLDEARDKIGLERLVFGSDHVSGQRVRGRQFLANVLGWYQDLPAQARKLGVTFSDDEIERLLGDNAGQVLQGRPHG